MFWDTKNLFWGRVLLHRLSISRDVKPLCWIIALWCGGKAVQVQRGTRSRCVLFVVKEVHLRLSRHLNLFMRHPLNSKERSFALPGYGSKTAIPHKEEQCAVNCSNTVWYLLVYIFEPHWRFVKSWPATSQRGKHNWQSINFGIISLNSSNFVLSLQLTPVIDNGNLGQLFTSL